MAHQVVELRIHGVSGASAEALLDHPVVIRVAGDDNAGFYRPRPGFGISDRPQTLRVEAYRWGALTAGKAVRTVSLLFLLPFMLVNLAVWTRPATGGAGGLIGPLCRLLAATLTAAYVLSILGVTVDIVGWQCVPYQPCLTGRGYLSWLGDLPLGPRLALLALVPIAALRLLWWLGERSARAFEAFPAARRQDRTQGGEDRVDAPGFWNDALVVQRLRVIHVAVGLGVLDASLLFALVHVHPTPVGYLLLGATWLLLAACVVLLTQPARSASSGPGRGPVDLRGIRPLRTAALALTVLALAYSTLTLEPEPPHGQLPGYEGAVAGLLAVQAVLLIALVGAVWHQRRRSRTTGASWLGGFASPVLAGAAVAAAYGFAAALVYRVADLLDRGDIPNPARPDRPDAPPLEPPVSYRWAALAGLATILVVAATVLWRIAVTRRRRRQLAEKIVRQDFPDPPSEALPRRDAVREIIARAAIGEHLGPVFTVFLILSLLGITTVALDLIGIGPSQLSTRLAGTDGQATTNLALATDVGMYVIGLAALGIVVLALFSYRSDETRRTVAVVWDLGTFWPRTVHPFAPPCYAERAVPELAKRVTGLTAHGGVILSGHSHGSVLATATLLQLPPEVLPRVALLTHGSPLHRVYARVCPAFFGDPTLYEAGERIGWRWVNLWRDTDSVGGPLFSAHQPGQPPGVSGPAGTVDRRLRDPRGITVPPDDTVPPPINRHWPYHTDEAYEAAVRELVGRLGAPSGPGSAPAAASGG
ncbi:hypothetical protein SAMN05443287_101436 [Micromonospora phaseoli]|uniref:Integral membrane protein n=1 Tax=Micromonospora phaseoli TaxID=1144548 RepID=A0A1H6RW86_9ACTN|nr:hypothetical protein [Micromonospora phaseoli]PZW03691.1 hypothetical protein CLV64_101436 [Micromonospora phaseoli]GIJ80325.1 hypothetical protein Xph01_47570 [Micromonospora phaseoli]SEI60001.1 hypothetical protein SAMN05443287_101436 [Micromonospora phaseoli]